MEANYFTILYWFCHRSIWICGRFSASELPLLSTVVLGDFCCSDRWRAKRKTCHLWPPTYTGLTFCPHTFAKNRAGRSVLLVYYSLNYIFVPWIPWMCSLSLWSYPVTTPQPERASSSSSTSVRWERGCHQVSGKPAGASQKAWQITVFPNSSGVHAFFFSLCGF